MRISLRLGKSVRSAPPYHARSVDVLASGAGSSEKFRSEYALLGNNPRAPRRRPGRSYRPGRTPPAFSRQGRHLRAYRPPGAAPVLWRNHRTSLKKKAPKEEMAQWMLVWLENPEVFPA